MEDLENLPDNQDIGEAESTLATALAEIKGEKRETLKLKPQEEEESLEEVEEPVEAKTKFVPTDDPGVQKRINELYKESRVANERNILLQDELRRVVEATEARESEYQKRFSEIENKTLRQDEETALSGLREQYSEAISSFNYEEAAKINERIVDFKAEQKLNMMLNQQLAKQPVKQKERSPVYSDTNPIDVAELNLLSSERDSTGNPVRPWLEPAHEKFNDVVNATAIIADRYLKKGQRPSLSQVIREVETGLGLGRKGISKELTHPPVLSSNTIAGGSNGNQEEKLSSEQRLFASKLGLSEKDYARTLRLSKSGPISMDSFKK